MFRPDADIFSYQSSVSFLVPGLMDAGGSLGGGTKNSSSSSCLVVLLINSNGTRTILIRAPDTYYKELDPIFSLFSLVLSLQILFTSESVNRQLETTFAKPVT